MNLSAYFDRIHFRGEARPTLETLRALYRAHLMEIPFENLEILEGRPARMDEGYLFEKLVTRRRGGVCFEHNFLFAAILREVGFLATVHPAAMEPDESRPDMISLGNDFEHAVVKVELDQAWLVDPGFSDAYREPLLLASREEQVLSDGCRFRLEDFDPSRLRLSKVEGGRWKPQYRFARSPSPLSAFAEMFEYSQRADVIYNADVYCSRLTERGRITLTEKLLIEVENGEFKATPIESASDQDRVLRERFALGA